MIKEHDNPKGFPKLLIYLAVGILFLASVFLVFWEINKDSASTPTGNTMKVSGRDGDVEVKNVFIKPVEQTSDTVVFAEDKAFKIVYFPKDEAFLITLLAKPLTQSQAMAEARFLSSLQIDEEQACRLNVNISVPYEVDSQASGKNMGLSFCE